MMEFWDDRGISWTICKQSAPYYRQIITPTPNTFCKLALEKHCVQILHLLCFKECIILQESFARVFPVVFQAFVFDFGSEMYVWTGKHIPLDVRRHVLKLASDQWQSGYNYADFPINPLCPLTR